MAGCQELMGAKETRLILATGGPAMVRAAYSSGKPAIGVGAGNGPAYICVQADMAKALGQCLSLLRPPKSPLLCMDGLQLTEDSFLDVGIPIGPALPVIIKTLVLNQS